MNSAFKLKNDLILGVSGAMADLSCGMDALRELGTGYCLVQLDWGELEPESGRFDTSAYDKLKDGLIRMCSCGINPLVSLHKGAGPEWFEAVGGWEKQENIHYYLRYVEKTVRFLGELTDEYITIAQANSYAAGKYLADTEKGDRRHISDVFRVMSVQAAAHIRAYRVIHNTRERMGCSETKVGFSLQMRYFEPVGRFVFNSVEAKFFDRLFQGEMIKAMALGQFRSPIKNCSLAKPGKYSDFCGLEYFTRKTVALSDRKRKKTSPKSDSGWDVYPEGLVRCAGEMHELAGVPVYVTANGVCDNDDAFRARFIYEHVGALCLSGAPVERYYYFCFADASGEEDSGFGLAKRGTAEDASKLKESGKFYGEMIKANGVSQDIYDRYISGSTYNM